ncbi:MAG: HEAT repeat domain-containing protein, partial [Desulfobacterales bacterium]
QIKSTVVACMIQYGGIDGILMAADELKTMLESADWKMRLAGVSVLKKIKVKQFYQPLEKLIHDENIRVQVEAIHAAGEMKSPFLLSALADKLAQQKTSRAAILALSRYGEDILEFLTTILEDINQKPDVRMHIPKIIRTIGTQQSLDVLMKNIGTKNDKIRNNIISEMARMAKSNRHLELDIKKITSIIKTETKNYYQQVVILSEIEKKIEPRLLGDALNLRAKRTAQRLLTLLSMLHPDQPIESITLGMISSDPSIRANALELLDNILEGEQKRPVLAIFEVDSIEQKRKLGQSYFNTLTEDSFIGWLQHLLDDDYHWVVACTIYQVGVSRIHELSAHLKQVLNGDNPLLTETARLALNALTGPETS